MSNTTRILLGFILALLMLIAMLTVKLYKSNEDKLTCEGKVNTIDLTSKENQKRYERYQELYDNDMKHVVQYYDKKIENLKKFKRRQNETSCEAANRLLNIYGS